MKDNKKRKSLGPGKKKPIPEKTVKKVLSEVSCVADPLCVAEGMELVNIEYRREAGGKTLRLYIDKPGGVTLDDCVNISRQLNNLLDVYFDNADPYKLEVSSPGPERPLSKEDDFIRFKGKNIKIKTTKLIDGRKDFMGLLLGITGATVNIIIDEKTIAIPYKQITGAQLVNNYGDDGCL